MATPRHSETIRDVRDAAQATRAALDAVAFIAREVLPPAQVAALAGVELHLRAALDGLASLDALASVGEASGESGADRGPTGGERGALDA